MRLTVPAGGPVILAGVAAQLEQLLAAAELKLDAECQALHVARVLSRCPIAAKLTTLRPYLRDVSAVVDAAGHSWRDTLQAVLAPSTYESATVEAPCTPRRSLPDERLRWLDSVVARAEQVRQIVVCPAAVGPQRTAALCDACFSIARWMQHLDEVDCAQSIVGRSAAMHALSRELAAPRWQTSDSKDGDCILDIPAKMPTLCEVSATSELTDDLGETFVKTKFVLVNHSRSACIQLEHLRISGVDGGSCHIVDLANTAVLLSHTKAKPSYSVYVLLVPLCQLRPTQISFGWDAAAGTDAAVLQACSRFAERGSRQRFQPRWPRYEFTWRFREVEANSTATDTVAERPGLWARLGF